ncbi:unnamed protein product [Candida parapsilosis]
MYGNTNQHQVITLAPLQSEIYLLVKARLYHYIYVYEKQGDFDLQCKIHFNSGVTCTLPCFTFLKYMNNYGTNSTTIISIQSLETYLEKMDFNEAIKFLIFFHDPDYEFFGKVNDHFTTIK